MISHTFKQKVYAHLVNHLLQKNNQLQIQLNELHQAVANETKSTVGDKYETARAMLQIDIANCNKQIQILSNEQIICSQIDINKICNSVSLGCLLETNIGIFFVGVAAKKLIVDSTIINFISTEAPIYKVIKGLKINKNLIFNGNKIMILNIY